MKKKSSKLILPPLDNNDGEPTVKVRKLTKKQRAKCREITDSQLAAVKLAWQLEELNRTQMYREDEVEKEVRYCDFLGPGSRRMSCDM